MVKTIIGNTTKYTNNKVEGPKLRVSEFFSETIQGEGINTGCPGTFLRLNGCTLNCIWCDSNEVWRYGQNYGISELLDMMEEYGVVQNFKDGQHLILTGGSPLMQQKGLETLIESFITRFGFKPYIEIENECTLMPSDLMVGFVDCWNNSPKLANSEMAVGRRYKPEVLKKLAGCNNSWFKFVVSDTETWKEIQKSFIDTGLIRKDQIILMPEGINQEELKPKYEWVVDLCTKHSVKMSDRFHITIWNKKTGV